MNALDASVLIAHFRSADTHHALATRFLADTGHEELWIGPLNLAEVLVGHVRAGTPSRITEALQQIGVREAGMPVDAAAQLASLRAATGLKMPDCCVLLTAQQTGSRVATFDDRLQIAASRLGLGIVDWGSV